MLDYKRTINLNSNENYIHEIPRLYLAYLCFIFLACFSPGAVDPLLLCILYMLNRFLVLFFIFGAEFAFMSHL